MRLCDAQAKLWRAMRSEKMLRTVLAQPYTDCWLADGGRKAKGTECVAEEWCITATPLSTALSSGFKRLAGMPAPFRTLWASSLLATHMYFAHDMYWQLASLTAAVPAHRWA